VPRGKKQSSSSSGAAASKSTPSIAATLFAAADNLRGNMDAAEYKYVAFGLIFLKYISDRVDARIAEVKANPEEAFLLDDPDATRDLIVSAGIFRPRTGTVDIPQRERHQHQADDRRIDRSGYDCYRGGERHAQGRPDQELRSAGTGPS
jgi:type I restriction-modification system DNA methylase subunit